MRDRISSGGSSNGPSTMVRGRSSPTSHVAVYSAEPADERARWWKAQIIRTAKHGGFFVNLTGGTRWCYLALLPPSQVDSVTLVYTDSAEARWPEVAEAVDRTLAAAIAALAEGFG